MKTVGVNQDPVRIYPSGRAGDSGCDTFTKEKKQMKSKQKELNEHLGTGSDPPIESDRKGVSHLGYSAFTRANTIIGVYLM